MYNEFIASLKYLGLTEYQARVLFALMKEGIAGTSKIEKISKVPKTRIYDTLNSLIKRDFVVSISDRPKKYMIKNVDIILDSLVEDKEKEFNNVRLNIGKMKELFKNKSITYKSIMTLDRSNFINMLREEIENANKSIYAVADDEINDYRLKDALKKAVKDNLTVKMLTKPEHSNALWDLGIEIKNKDHNNMLYIIDDQKALLKIGKSSNYHLALVGKEDGLYNMAKLYFDNLWKK